MVSTLLRPSFQTGWHVRINDIKKESLSVRRGILAGHAEPVGAAANGVACFSQALGWFSTAWAYLMGVVVIVDKRKRLGTLLLTAAENGDATNTKVMGGSYMS